MNILDQEISIVMISMNEEKAIKSVISGIQKYTPNAEIVIIDSSSDKTAEIAEEFLNVKLIKQFPPIGYGPAMSLALRSATRKYIVTLDCDNTYPPEAILHMVEMMKNNSLDLVDGSRLRSKPKNMPWINYLGNIFFGLIASILFFRIFLDLHSGMRVYLKDSLEKFSWREKEPALPVELLLMMQKKNKNIGIYYIDYFERKGESKMSPLPTMYWTMYRILSVRFSRG
jgi:glycosyltransferase involved in cell wall biosynthesis